ncbi:MAG: protein disulfide oxidoreductase [Armatimonadota bacterium]
MAMISDHDREFLKNKFTDELKDQVKLIVFLRKNREPGDSSLECEFCRETEGLIKEVADISSKISVEFREYSPDDKMITNFGIDKYPAIVLMNNNNAGIKYYGIPGGFEFSSFIEDIIDVSRSTTDLSKKSKDRIHDVSHDIHIKVFVTPTCPFCPSVARIAHQMAIENPRRIKADIIEASEFPDLVSKYKVKAVPTIVINEEILKEGAISEDEFTDEVTMAAV